MTSCDGDDACADGEFCDLGACDSGCQANAAGISVQAVDPCEAPQNATLE